MRLMRRLAISPNMRLMASNQRKPASHAVPLSAQYSGEPPRLNPFPHASVLSVVKFAPRTEGYFTAGAATVSVVFWREVRAAQTASQRLSRVAW